MAATIGAVLRIIANIPIPDRDRKEVREFVATLPRNQNHHAEEWQIQMAQRLAE